MLYISNTPRSYEQELISIFQPFKTFQKESLVPTPTLKTKEIQFNLITEN